MGRRKEGMEGVNWGLATAGRWMDYQVSLFRRFEYLVLITDYFCSRDVQVQYDSPEQCKHNVLLTRPYPGSKPFIAPTSKFIT